jgi:lambda family phage portal protein
MVITVDALGPAPFRYTHDDGTKFPGGYGPTELLLTDYWTLRQRSSELFERNLYARGIVRRLVENEINVGLHLEATPDETILGHARDSLVDWSELTETRFALWGARPRLCDHAEQQSFGALQAQARLESLVAGDVLVLLRQDPRTRLPRVQLINGAAVQTPFALQFKEPSGGNRVEHGVELDDRDRHVAYWILQRDGQYKRLPAYGEKSGRRLAWLLYGTDKRLDDVRGKPLLALVLQNLKEIDRYRDSVQRKALINAMLAMFIKKGEERMGTRPITGGAVRRGTETTVDTAGTERTFKLAEFLPGAVIEELQVGEEPVPYVANGTTEGFGEFERAIVQAIAWPNGIPPEILTLSFNSNYSASQAAINEFKLRLNVVRHEFGDRFCQPVYEDWLLSEVLTQKHDAQGLLKAWRDPSQYDVLGAWLLTDWAGQIKPAVDLSKLVRGYRMMVAEGFITRARATRELTGMKYSRLVQQLALENVELARAHAPLAPPEPDIAPEREDDSDDDDAKDDDDDDEASKLARAAVKLRSV